MRIYLFILLAGITISGQTNDVTNALNFYPLHIGDYWQYQVTRQNYGTDTTWIVHKEILGDTLALNGKRYFIVNEVGIFTPNYDGQRVSYIRMDSLSANVYKYSQYDNNEILIDSLLSQKDDIIIDCYMDTGDTTKELFGETTRIKTRQMYCVTNSHNDGWELAEGLGVIMGYYADRTVTLINYQYDLLYAKIADIEYGELSHTDSPGELPTDYILYQNYPNPFNPTTRISYSLSNPGKVSIIVYDILGKEVAVLLNEEKAIGNYYVDFVSDNLSSGIYFYQLKANNFVETKKMVLLR